MNAPVMLAPIFGADSAVEVPPLGEIVATFRHAAANTASVMPPLAARWLAEQFTHAANVMEHDGAMLRTIGRWLDAVDEINAYADRACHHTEHEVFLTGSSPEDAAYTEPAETQGDALAASQWLVGAGAAHRPVIHLYGSWQIDRPATTAKESAA